MIVRQARTGDAAPARTRFGFTINCWDGIAVEAELKRRGLKPQSYTDKGFWFHDREGNEIGVFAPDWMSSRPPAPAENPVSLQALSANHIVVVSTDCNALAAWYHDLIALNQTTDSGRDENAMGTATFR
jgi:hypothetical protein